MPDFRERCPRVSAFLPAAQASAAKDAPSRSMALLSYGFRPFFLGASVWAILSLAPWIGVGIGWVFAEGYGPVAWHVHETLFGFCGAAVAGFLLTAIPNWTGRPPLTGIRLAALFALWCAGRAAVLALYAFGPLAVAAVDGAFLPVLTWLAARDVVAARNWRNLKTVALLGLFAAANIGFHYESLIGGARDQSTRLGIAALIGLMMLIGGRMAQNFTHQWMLARGADRLPPPFGRFDEAALVVAGAGLLLWVLRTHGMATTLLLALAGVLQLLRMSRWRGLSTWREPLVLILHLGYAFVALGFLLVSASMIFPDVVPPTAALHAWTTGAIGTMMLGVMTRASRGHTGRPFTASALTTGSYVAVVLAALLRIGAGMLPPIELLLVTAAAIAWMAGFLLFMIEHALMLVRNQT
ncbi:NnrS family protein [Chelativorans sp. AA-79]|uniref:NnrS family protein n=1 Tax=Chelativorans sp. AA-79 TaxID=3028735 RepID=UPI0023FA018E|nr:NnrS family protein [Chelativorans sp. AA-79]WEX08569.1 NnrS family protein [Chelativorans sp. AA-79]